MKKLVSIILTVLLLVSVLPMGAFTLTASAAKSGYYTYTISNGEATITDVSISISGDIVVPSKLGGYSVTRIGKNAFSSCSSLTSITIPDSVTSIGDSAFYYCTRLKSITLPFIGADIGGSGNYDDVFGYIFGYTSNDGSGDGPAGSIRVERTLQYYSSNKFYYYFIPSSLESVFITKEIEIPCYAFYGCKNLYSITIPNSVTSIGEDAFYNCSGLTSINVAQGNTKYHSAGNCLIETDSKTLIQGCNTSVIPSDGSVTSIGDYAFYRCSGLTSITIPDSVTEIGVGAFSNCTGLTSITIPDSVTSIGNYAFRNCTGLTSVTIGNGVTSIGDSAFYRCTGLTSITIPDSVTSIGDSSFYDCDGLTNVTIGNGVTSIAEDAFYSCSSLTSITIPDSVTSIGNSAFGNCTRLTTVYYRGTKAQKTNIDISTSNYSLTSATWYYETCIGKVEHVFSNACDDICNDCENTRIPPHSYNNDCDTDCNICGDIRTITHSYEWVIDKQETCGKNGTKHEECSICQATRSNDTIILATGNHTYDNTCDTECNVCHETRTITHNYEWVIDEQEDCGNDGYKHEECSVCHAKRNGNTKIPATGDHKYSNACDKDCNICGNSREVGDHKYDYACDSVCNECGYVREALDHNYTLNNYNTCSVCKYSKAPNAPTLHSKTQTTVTLTKTVGFEYSKDGVNWQSSNIVEGLIANTTYTFYQRVAESENSMVSESSDGISITTNEKIACPNNPQKPIVSIADTNSITLVDIPGYEYSRNGTSWQTSPNFTGLSSNTSYTFYQRIKETEKELASEKSEGVSVKTLSTGGASSYTYYDRLENYIESYGSTSSDGYKTIIARKTSGTLVAYYMIQNKDDGIFFQFLTTSTKSSYIGSNTEFTLYKYNRYIYVDFSMLYYYNGTCVDAVGEIITIDRSQYNYSKTYYTTESGTYIEASDFQDSFNDTLEILCEHWDLYIYDDLSFGLEEVGFLSFNGAGKKVCDIPTSYHNGTTETRNNRETSGCVVDGYTGDKYCSSCNTKLSSGSVIPSSGHDYDDSCDADCNECGYIRTVEHTYTNDCDETCDLCNEERTVAHAYESDCDEDCNECGNTITPRHLYDDNCSESCALCGNTRIPPHDYDGDCDTECNICHTTRVTSTEHTYDNENDLTCNVCSEERATGGHIYDNDEDMICNGCGYDRGIPDKVTSDKHTVSGNTISKITAGATVEDVLANLGEGEYCKVFKGNNEVDSKSAIGTGMKVKIMDGNTVKAEYTIIVTGDTNGDGAISVTDMISIKSHLLGKSNLSDEYATAADTSGDSGISITDFIQIKAKILGKGDIIAK